MVQITFPWDKSCFLCKHFLYIYGISSEDCEVSWNSEDGEDSARVVRIATIARVARLVNGEKRKVGGGRYVLIILLPIIQWCIILFHITYYNNHIT